MKAEDIKKLYEVSPKIQESIEYTLRQLDGSSIKRSQRRRITRRFVIAFAVIALLVAFSSVAYATKMFGLLIEPVGKYGLDIQVEQSSTESVTAAKRHAKPTPTYLPKGCCQILDNNEDDTNVLGDEGVTVYNPNGNYIYTNSKDAYGEPGEAWVHLFMHEADGFHENALYIVDRSETEYDGHKTVFLTRQFEDNGEKDYYAFKYFEDWGYVAEVYYDNMSELMKIMEGLELQEADDYVEAPTLDESDVSNGPYDDYAFSMDYETREYKLGETFSWSQQIVRAPLPEYSYNDGECEITVKSVKENDGIKGLDKNNLIYDDEEWYSRYFNSDGGLKTPYTRTNRNNGDGTDTLGHTRQQEIKRLFYLVTVEVKNGSFNGQYMTNAGGVLYQEQQNKDGAEIYTIGVVVDEDEQTELALSISSFETVIDDKTQTAVRKDVDTVVPLFVNQ